MPVKMMNQYLIRRRAMQDSDYYLLRDAYYGDGGFLTGKYLKKHIRERDEKFRNRQDICYYLNYVAPVVNSHVGPVFAKATIRDWEGDDPLFEKFYEDADRDGTAIDNFMKSAAIVSKLFGTAYIVVDNVGANEQPTILKEAIETRACPYAYLVNPVDVTEIVRGYKGGITKFSYLDGEDEENRIYERTWTPTTWEVRRNGELIDSGEHKLGMVPVVALHSRKAIRMEGVSDTYVPQPSEFLSITKANVRIFNLCSELDEILRNQTFSILVYPAKDPKELTIGTDSAMGWDAENVSSSPHFIAPPADPANLIMGQIDRLIKEIYRMAMLTHVTGVSEASSGIARQWDYEKTNQALADFAANLQEAELKIAKLYCAWTKSKVKYICKYPNDFSITNVQQEISDAFSLLNMGFRSKFNAAIKKKLARIVLEGNTSSEEYDEIISEIQAEAEEAGRGDELERPGGMVDVSAADMIAQVLSLVQMGQLAPEAARNILVSKLGVAVSPAEAMMAAQAKLPPPPAPEPEE